jgi:hypothetical protein
VWWYTPVIPALRKQRQENLKSKASLGYLVTNKQKFKKRGLGSGGNGAGIRENL